jgi:hypothetical protein
MAKEKRFAVIQLPESALIVATELLLAVIRSQNAPFSLKLDADIEACTNDLRDAQARDLSST